MVFFLLVVYILSCFIESYNIVNVYLFFVLGKIPICGDCLSLTDAVSLHKN